MYKRAVLHSHCKNSLITLSVELILKLSKLAGAKKNGLKTVIGHHRVVDVNMSSSTEILTPKALNILDQVPSHYNTTT